ncbi:SEC59 [Candida margitis]|uniref:SEC59 n=1 Tax=Candida margitis TaxID=1775924 RepID=UPI002227AB83|nr:SEC59 [Candida margitis]KAI5966070.1 SEC59 [Candida margitis]
MARTRSGSKKASAKEDITLRSTASIFKNADPALLEEDEEKQKKKKNKAEDVNADKEPLGNAQDDIENAGFPFNYLYKFQDFLNEHVNLLKGVQLLLIGFFIQLIYLNQDKFDHLKSTLPMIFFSCVGIVACMVLSIVRSKSDKLHVPDFNYFYCVLIPSLIGIVHFDRNWIIVNCALNYFVIDQMNPIFNLISSVIFFEIYKEDSKATLDTFQFIQIGAAHFFFSFALNHINDINIHGSEDGDVAKGKSSLKKSEIQLVCLLLVNILFNRALTDMALPLQIFQKLAISFVVTGLFAYPVFAFLPGLVNIGLFGGIFCYLTIFQLNQVVGKNALTWLYEYIDSDPEKIYLIKVWASSAVVVIPLVFLLANSVSLNVRRKVWHLYVIFALTFSGEILFGQVQFTLIALLGMIVVFLIVEVFRLNQISFIGKYLFNVLAKFQDSKDKQGPLNLSYIYLLAGITTPVVYDYLVHGERASVIRYIGPITLGVGDTLASVIGRKFGSIKWKGSEKSVQGTVAFFVGSLLAVNAVEYINAGNKKYLPVANWENLVVSIILAALLEGTSDLNDNYLTPIFLPAAYELLNRCY